MTARSDKQSAAGRRRTPPHQKVLWAGVKIGAASLLITLIAFGVVIFDEDGSVSESHADIFDIFTTTPDQEQFQDSLASLGHDNIQTFDLNGNIVHFSVDYSSEPAGQVAERYQREFVNRNINSQIYDGFDPSMDREMMTARLTGEIAPVKVEPGRVVLGGMISRNSATDDQELLEEAFTLDDPSELFRAHRWVEIFEQPGGDETTILASWSNDDFSFANMFPNTDRRTQGLTNHGADPTVPSCPGCKRVNKFDDLDEDRDYRSNVYVSEDSVDGVQLFYRQAMSRRGWQPTEFSKVFEQINPVINQGRNNAELLQFEKGDRKLEIFVFPLDNGKVAAQTTLWGAADEMQASAR